MLPEGEVGVKFSLETNITGRLLSVWRTDEMVGWVWDLLGHTPTEHEDTRVSTALREEDPGGKYSEKPNVPISARGGLVFSMDKFSRQRGASCQTQVCFLF